MKKLTQAFPKIPPYTIEPVDKDLWTCGRRLTGEGAAVSEPTFKDVNGIIIDALRTFGPQGAPDAPAIAERSGFSVNRVNTALRHAPRVHWHRSVHRWIHPDFASGLEQKKQKDMAEANQENNFAMETEGFPLTIETDGKWWVRGSYTVAHVLAGVRPDGSARPETWFGLLQSSEVESGGRYVVLRLFTTEQEALQWLMKQTT